MSIDIDSPRTTAEIFHKYSDSETHDFNKTHIIVSLAKVPETEFISRTEAKRLVSGLELFEVVMLDFSNVRTIGQGFADEIFRVFTNRYPKIVVDIKNANENVMFMIDHVRKTKNLGSIDSND